MSWGELEVKGALCSGARCLPRPVVLGPSHPRWAFYSLAVAVALTRIYVGAHMPLDVIGGAGYGVVVGSVVNLAVGIKADGRAS